VIGLGGPGRADAARPEHLFYKRHFSGQAVPPAAQGREVRRQERVVNHQLLGDALAGQEVDGCQVRQVVAAVQHGRRLAVNVSGGVDVLGRDDGPDQVAAGPVAGHAVLVVQARAALAGIPGQAVADGLAVVVYGVP